MRWQLLAAGITFALVTFAAGVGAEPAATVYTLPQDIHWLPLTGKGVPGGAFYAYVRGKQSDRCDWIMLTKFSNGFVYPMHVNDAYLLFTVLKGTLVIGFDREHRKSAERILPAGSLMQGLATEPHYGRAIGETIFEIYAPCLRS